MKILAYDTSGELLTAALVENDRVVRVEESASSERHSTTLIPFLKKVLKRARWKGEDLDLLAVGIGPGSFTGIRVGVTTAKLLGLVWKTKLVGVSSLEALAYQADDLRGCVPVAIDARRGRIYAASYEKKNGTWTERIAPRLTTLEEFCKKTGRPVSVLERPIVRALSIARVAYEHAKKKRFKTPDSLQPLYLHPRDCNVTKKK